VGDGDPDQGNEELRLVASSTGDAGEQGRGEKADNHLTGHRPPPGASYRAAGSTIAADGRSARRSFRNTSVLRFRR
jgi:hypothetical protein